MALRWIDSFDHYAQAQVEQKYDTITDNPYIATGRFGNGLGCFDGNTPDSVTKLLDSQATWIVGFATRITSAFSAGSKEFLRIMDGATTQVSVRYNTSTHRIEVVGPGGVLGTSATTMLVATWYYFELKTTIADAPSGTWEFRMDGVVETSGTGDTRAASTLASADSIRLCSGDSAGSSQERVFDDFYVCDTTGGANDDFLGDVRVQCIFPSGNGNSSQLVGSDANSTDNYLLVDETTTINDADYVESATVGEKDTYAYGNVTPTTGTVYGVQIVPRALKTDAGLRSIKAVARHSATEEDSATDMALSTSAHYFTDLREEKPGGGTWSISDVNGAEFGVKVTV